VTGFERHGEQDQEPDGGSEGEGQGARDRRPDPKADDIGIQIGIHDLDAAGEDPVWTIEPSFMEHEGELENRLAAVSGTPLYRVQLVEQQADKANLYRDLGELRIARGVGVGLEDLDAAWEAVTEGLRIAEAAQPPYRNRMLLEAHAAAALHSADRGGWRLSDQHLVLARASLHELLSASGAEGVSTFALDNPASLDKQRLFDTERKLAELMLDQGEGDQPEWGDAETAWLRLQGIEQRHGKVPHEHELWPAFQRDLLVATMRAGRETSPTDTLDQAELIAGSYNTHGRFEEEGRTWLILTGDFAERFRQEGETKERQSWFRQVFDGSLQRARLACVSAYASAPDRRSTLSLLGAFNWTEAVLRGHPHMDGPEREQAKLARDQLISASDPRAVEADRRLQASENVLPQDVPRVRLRLLPERLLGPLTSQDNTELPEGW